MSARRQARCSTSTSKSSGVSSVLATASPAIRVVQTRAAALVGRAVGDVVNLLAPEIVVLGGGLVEAMPELYLESVERAARERAAPPFAKTFKIAAAKLGDDAVIRGTAAWAQAMTVKE